MSRRSVAITAAAALAALAVLAPALAPHVVPALRSLADVGGRTATHSASATAPALAGAPQRSAVPRALPPEPIGSVDTPQTDPLIGPALRIAGWALDPSGAARVEVRMDGRSYPAQVGLHRPDVAQAHPGYPSGDRAGFVFEGEWPHLAGTRHEVAIVAVGASRETVLARKHIDFPSRPRHWGAMLDERRALAREPVHFLMMASAVSEPMVREIATRYAAYVSRTLKVGLSVPILYLRSTRGAAHDWVFDPAFDTTRRCGNRAVVEDNLDRVLGLAVAHHLPVQIILNGGIWSDASCESPAWDLTDHLEQDPRNVQWTQDDRAFPDNFLKGQAGSTESPELARSLTYNVHAREVRDYKRRNLQAAASRIATFAREHPELFVGVALDADTYMNPFLRQGGHKEIFDYNPGMIRQFREWLQGSGPYAGTGGPGVPDLRAYRRTRPATLAEVNRLARRQWARWEDVDPPRRFPGHRDPLVPGEPRIWDDPWWHEWDRFRKHVIDLHYDELSSWAHAAGIPRAKIFSAQGGFLEPDPGLSPFAIDVTAAGESYDSAGVSLQGSIPRDGHLGVILYGPGARNQVTMAGPHSLFATFARLDEGWGVVEFNPTDLRKPTEQTDYATSYRALREMLNYGAREISTMAWNGSNGLVSHDPAYVPYTAWRNTPGEDAMRDVLDARADLPRGAWLWTFGSPRLADDDGWAIERGRARPEPGRLQLEPDDGTVALVSPPGLVVRPRRIDTLLLRVADPRTVRAVRVSVRDGRDRPWEAIVDEPDAARRLRRDGNHALTLRWPARMLSQASIVEQIRIVVEYDPAVSTTRLERVALYPRAAAGS
jgi:hypothetical protein